jgi:hypothetical protein
MELRVVRVTPRFIHQEIVHFRRLPVVANVRLKNSDSVAEGHATMQLLKIDCAGTGGAKGLD